MAALRGFSLEKLSKVRILFSVYDKRATSARELMRRVTSTKMRESNPKCDVAYEVKGDLSSPIVDLTFSDGTTLHIDTSEITALDIIKQIYNHKQSL